MSGPLTRHVGDIPLSITVPPTDRQRTAAHLDQYLPGPVGQKPRGGYRFTARTGAALTRAATASWEPCADTTLTPVPGVTLTEARSEDGRRRYTLASDALELRPGSWAAQISGTDVDLYVADARRMPRYLLRLIREVMLREYENSGAVVFHAAGAALPGGAVMICGPQGAGKTTTLAALLSSAAPRAELLSNDRLIATRDRLVAVPLPVPLARGTLEAFPALQSAAARPIVELPRDFGTRNKIPLSALGFASALGTRIAAAAPARLLLVPHLTDTDRPLQIERLDAARALTILETSCFTPTDEFWRPWLVPRSRPEEQLAATAHQACARLAQTVPCHRVTFGVRRPLRSLMSPLTDLIGDLLP